MTELKYVRLEALDPEDLRTLLNKQKVREHLISHELFDSNTLKLWIQEKNKVDRTHGCRIRGIISDNSVAGWCGIQLEDGRYEIAIVLDDIFWGKGKQIFRETLGWAKELGHNEIYLNLLNTRPEYRFLRKISKNVSETEMYGNKFTTYQISVH